MKFRFLSETDDGKYALEPNSNSYGVKLVVLWIDVL